MAFVETPRFPVDISVGSKFGPGYSTSIARNLGGFEQNNQNWSMPLHIGDVIFGCRTQPQLNNLLAYFHGVAGMHNGFRFKSFNDYTATGSQGTVTVIDATHWQMYKTYTFGALSKARKITKPIAGAVIAGGGSYSYDTATGIITKLSGADPTGWVGEFDFPVRFNLDEMLPQWLDVRFHQLSSVPIVELRL